MAIHYKSIPFSNFSISIESKKGKKYAIKFQLFGGKWAGSVHRDERQKMEREK